MPKRKHNFCNGYYYHIYNRGSNRQTIFNEPDDYYRFYCASSFYRFQNLPLKLSSFIRLKSEESSLIAESTFRTHNQKVSLLCYSFMLNHFHLLISQHIAGGISNYLHDLTDSYTHYFNMKYERSGSLFQGRFKSVLIKSDEQLLHLSRYIHLNPVTSGILSFEQLESYPWTSLPEYLKSVQGICEKKLILKHFSSEIQYKDFVLSRKDHQKTLNLLKNLTLD